MPGPLELPSHYTDLALLAQGGMGVLFRARDARTGRHVAVKTLPADLVDPRGDVRARFLREARAIARLAHPYVVTIVELDANAERPWFAMELVEGEDLAARTARERLDVRVALRIALDVCDALEHVHRAGVLHRDLKPSNVMLVPGGGVKVLDFGLARVHDEETRVTRTGQVVGTPAYMAPEQLEGQPLDGRADLYALASMLYELLTGEPPFSTDTCYLKALRAPRTPSASNPAVTPSLDGVVMRALAARREDRPPDASALKRALAACLREVDELDGATAAPLDETAEPPESAREAPRVLEPGAVRDVVALRAELAGGAPARVVCRLADEVARHGGEVDRYEPGGFVAFFGMRATGEADAERAVAAGIEMASRAARLGGRLQVAVELARLAWRPDRPPDDASFRVLAAPRPELSAGVWVSDRIARRIERRFLLGAPEGDAGLIQVTGVDAVAAEDDRRAARSAGPLVGRREELAAARAFWLAACQDAREGVARPSLLSVVGPPGIGKSRLVDAVLAEIPEDLHPHLRATASGLVDQPFRLAGALVRRALGLSGPGVPAERAKRLVERVRALRPPRPLEVTAGLADLLGLARELDRPRDEDADTRLDRLHAAVGALFAALAKRVQARLGRPLIVVLDDLEECDLASRAALEAMIAGASATLFLVATFRPPWALPERWRRHAHTKQLTVGPLPPRDARKLLRQSVEGDADEDDLLTRAGGVPLFLEELAKARDEQEDESVPSQLEAVLRAQMDRLATTERELLEVAAVLGPPVDPLHVEEVLRALHGAAPADLAVRFDRLVRGGLLVPVADGDAEAFAFRPPLAREVAERALLPANRRVLHRLAVKVLSAQENADDATLERIAQHADATGDRALALSTARDALARASARMDAAATRRLADRALALMAGDAGAERDRATFDVLSERERALELDGARDGQRADLMRMRELATSLKDESRLAIALDRLSRFCWWHRGDARGALELARQSLAIHTRRGDPGGQAAARRNLGCALSIEGDYVGALAEHNRALALFRRVSDAGGESRTLCSLAINAGELGRVQEAFEHVRAAMALEKRRPTGRGTGMALRALADLYRGIGDDDRALACYERALAGDLEIGYRHGEAHSLAAAATVLRNAGRDDEARARAADALDVALAVEARAVAVDALLTLAALEPREGEALILTARAVSLARELSVPRVVAVALAAQAHALATVSRFEDALEASDRSLAELAKCGPVERAARDVWYHRALVLRAAGAREAPEAVQKAKALVHDRAARLSDERLKKSFLERVRIHREIAAL